MEKTIQQEILERIVRIETKIDTYNNYREKTEDAYSRSKSNQHRIDRIEDNTKWLWRTIVGALIMSFLAAFVKLR